MPVVPTGCASSPQPTRMRLPGSEERISLKETVGSDGRSIAPTERMSSGSVNLRRRADPCTSSTATPIDSRTLVSSVAAVSLTSAVAKAGTCCAAIPCGVCAETTPARSTLPELCAVEAPVALGATRFSVSAIGMTGAAAPCCWAAATTRSVTSASTPGRAAS